MEQTMTSRNTYSQNSSLGEVSFIVQFSGWPIEVQLDVKLPHASLRIEYWKWDIRKLTVNRDTVMIRFSARALIYFLHLNGANNQMFKTKL